jgi:hypothetical protein
MGLVWFLECRRCSPDGVAYFCRLRWRLNSWWYRPPPVAMWIFSQARKRKTALREGRSEWKIEDYRWKLQGTVRTVRVASGFGRQGSDRSTTKSQPRRRCDDCHLLPRYFFRP